MCEHAQIKNTSLPRIQNTTPILSLEMETRAGTHEKDNSPGHGHSLERLEGGRANNER